MRNKEIAPRDTRVYAFLALALMFVLKTNAAAQTPVTVSIDSSRSTGLIDLTRYALGQGGLSELPMIGEHIDQVRQLQPQTINFFVQEYFDLYPAHGRYHWVTLDKAIEAVLATGAKPIMNLCFKPKILYPKIDDKIVDPTDYAEWEELMFQLVRHCNQDRKFGIEYWLVANEGDIGEPGGVPYKFPTFQKYLSYYQHTVSGIRRADPKAKVGGPAPANCKSPFIDDLVDAAGRGEVPLDFLCFHTYSNDPGEFGRLVESMRAKLAKHAGLSKTETMIDQWNMSLDNPVMNPYFQPSFVMETTLAFYRTGLNRSSYYHIRDYFVDPVVFSKFLSERGTAFMARWWNEMPQYDGLWDNQGRLRPAYYAFKLLSLIKGQELPVTSTNPDVKALAARGGWWVNVALWNFPSDGPGKPYEVNVQLSSAGKGRVRVVRLNPDSAVNNLEQIRNGAISSLDRDPLRVTLRPYEIYWIEVTE